MNKKIITTFLLVISSTLLAQNATTLYIKGLSISVLAEPKNGAPVIEKLERGATVSKINEHGFWTQIKTGKGAGWVPKLTLANTPPAEQENLFDKKVDISSSARKRASNFTSAGAARGLNESSEDFDKANLKADFKALKKMESFYVAPEKAFKNLRGL